MQLYLVQLIPSYKMLIALAQKDSASNFAQKQVGGGVQRENF
jgi:hypothetical protein